MRKLIKTENVQGYIAKHFPDMQRRDFVGLEEAARALKEEIIIADDPELTPGDNIAFQVETHVNGRADLIETFEYTLQEHDSVSVRGFLINYESFAKVLSQHSAQ